MLVQDSNVSKVLTILHQAQIAAVMVTPCFVCRFRNETEGYACGGSGSLFRTDNGGKSWKRDRSTDNVPGNLYAVKFSEKGVGFILGNDGILLRYIA